MCALDQIDAPDAQIERLTSRIDELVEAISAARAPAEPADGQSAGSEPADDNCSRRWIVLDRIPGLARRGAQVVLAEIGLDVAQFSTAGQPGSWTRLCPCTIRSGPTYRARRDLLWAVRENEGHVQLFAGRGGVADGRSPLDRCRHAVSVC